MHINIVTVSSGWILQKISERTASNCKVNGVRMTVSHEADPNADANYYADLQNCYFGQKTKFDVAYFTHADMNSKVWLENLLLQRNGFKLDGIVSMNKRYTDMLEEVGYPKDKLATITPGQTYDTFKLRKIVIGIVSRGGYPGYGQQFMERLLLEKDLSNFKFRFLGNGWENIKPIANAKRIEVEFINDADYSVYPKFYHEIDYLLIPSQYTAGPISFQEALACGTPVISADVGFANYEFKADYLYRTGDIEDLYNTIHGIEKKLLSRRAQVEGMSWEKYAEDVTNFIIKMMELKKVKQYDNTIK